VRLLLCSSTVEAARDSKLPIATTQHLIESLSVGLQELIQSRAQLAKAVRDINFIQMKSNLRETGFGCPNGWAPVHKGKEIELTDT
jgi:hypothetical protein